MSPCSSRVWECVGSLILNCLNSSSLVWFLVSLFSGSDLGKKKEKKCVVIFLSPFSEVNQTGRGNEISPRKNAGENLWRGSDAEVKDSRQSALLGNLKGKWRDVFKTKDEVIETGHTTGCWKHSPQLRMLLSCRCTNLKPAAVSWARVVYLNNQMSPMSGGK